MSIKSIESQERNMRRLAELLGHDLSYIGGERESGPNGEKKVFLNLGKTFLRALAKDLGLHDAKVTSNPGGIAVSGECSLYGMWENGGICVCISQPCLAGVDTVLYRSIRHVRDYKGGHNQFVSRSELATMSYDQFLNRLLTVRKDAVYERAA